MEYYIGIDGGGSKTVLCIADENGYILGTVKEGSASYKQLGISGLIELLQQGISEVCGLAEGNSTKIAACCFGMPNYGESQISDKEILQLIGETFNEYPFYVVNDCEVGWAASLLLQPGINIVAGTGTIAYGRNKNGKTARCGGWSEWFSDEGSGRWLGLKCVQLFSKQADGRLEQGPLYHLVRESLGIKQDEDIIDLFETEYIPYRDRVALLQPILLKAAREGDSSAINAYHEAVDELIEIAKGVKKQLFREETCLAACSGGIFKIHDLIKEPFMKKAEAEDMIPVNKELEPYVGAVLLAVEKHQGSTPEQNFLEAITK